MKSLKKPIIIILAVIGSLWHVIVLGSALLVVIMVLTSGPSKQQIAAIGDIRDVCAEPMEQAYWLMLDHVPEPDGMESYHSRRESEWEPEAYALMREAGRLAQIAVGRTELEDGSFTFFYPGGESGQWYMLLALPFDRMHLIYYPFDIGSTGPWTPIEGHPHWFYDTAAY